MVICTDVQQCLKALPSPVCLLIDARTWARAAGWHELTMCAISQAANVGHQIYLLVHSVNNVPIRLLPCIGRFLCAPHICKDIVPLGGEDALWLDFRTMHFQCILARDF